jgi:hypothetical protein
MLTQIAKHIFNLVPEAGQKKLRVLRYQLSKKPAAGPPPSEVKQAAISRYQASSGHKVLIETGTYLGDMVEAQKNKFNRIISIELGQKLWANAVERFKQHDHITILQGDSGQMLNSITSQLNEPAIFWLDGHYSGDITAKGEKECPVLNEIDAIFAYKQIPHIILVDDARLFVGEHDYPTLEELTKYVQGKNCDYRMEVKDDIIRYTVK